MTWDGGAFETGLCSAGWEAVQEGEKVMLTTGIGYYFLHVALTVTALVETGEGLGEWLNPKVNWGCIMSYKYFTSSLVIIQYKPGLLVGDSSSGTTIIFHE